MAQFYDHIPPKQIAFIQDQHLFFIATAPKDGRINLSPKGLDTLRVLDPRTVAYLDLTGSGNETAAHLLENGRATLMFCGFKKQPLILRLYCTGEAVGPRDPRFENLAEHFTLLPGTRQIILLNVQSVQTSCGFAVPYYQFEGTRPTLVESAEKKGEEGMADYRAKKNRTSIDGLPTPPLD